MSEHQTVDGRSLVPILAVVAAALLVAAGCGLRGGRIFPAAFMGVTIGLLVPASQV